MKYILIALLLVISKISTAQETNTFIISAINLDSVEFTIKQCTTTANNFKIHTNKISDFTYEYNLEGFSNYVIRIKDLKNNKTKSIYINTGRIIKNLTPLKFNADFNTTSSLHIRYNKKLKMYEYLILK